jgi:polyhydroxyalkanoate synthesis regulator phasin
MKRLIWLPLAGFLLVAGAAVAAAAPTITAVADSALASLTDSNTESEPRGAAFHARFGGAEVLDQVLADLVKAGTISQEQSDAITEALTAEIDARRTAAEEHLVLMQGFIDDGVITQAEIDQLPADSPMRELWNSIAEDGQVSVDQLRELRPGFGPGHGPGRGFGPGHGPWMNGAETDIDPGTDSNT